MFSLHAHKFEGSNLDVYTCNKQDNQRWIWDESDGSIRSKESGDCLTLQSALEVWVGSLSDGSQAVVLLNRADNGSEPITVKWSDIGFPIDHSAVVRDLWTCKDIGTFTGSYTSPNIDYHAVMMLKITLTA